MRYRKRKRQHHAAIVADLRDRVAWLSSDLHMERKYNRRSIETLRALVERNPVLMLDMEIPSTLLRLSPGGPNAVIERTAASMVDQVAHKLDLRPVAAWIPCMERVERLHDGGIKLRLAVTPLELPA